MQASMRASHSPYSSTFSPGQTDALSSEPSEHSADLSSHADSPGINTLLDPSQQSSALQSPGQESPSQHSPVPAALLQNAAQLDHAAAVNAQPAADVEAANVPKAISGSTGQIAGAAMHAPEAAVGQHSLDVDTTSYSAANVNHTGACVFNTAVNQQSELRANSLGGRNKSSADFTRISAATDGHLSVIEKVYFATPDALAGIAASEPAEAAASGADTAAAAPASPAAADEAADALLEASMTDLAHEPLVPVSQPEVECQPPPQHAAVSVAQPHITAETSSEAPPQHSRLSPNLKAEPFARHSRLSPGLKSEPFAQHSRTSPAHLHGSPEPSRGVHPSQTPRSISQSEASMASPSQLTAEGPAAQERTSTGVSLLQASHAQGRQDMLPVTKQSAAMSAPKPLSLPDNSNVAPGASLLSTASLHQVPKATASTLQTLGRAAASPQASSVASPSHGVDAKAKQGTVAGYSHRQHSPCTVSRAGMSPSERDAALRKLAELQKQLNSTSTKLQVQLH